MLAALMLAMSACGTEAAVSVDRVEADLSADVDAGSATDDADAPDGPDLGLIGFGSLEGTDVAIFFWAEW